MVKITSDKRTVENGGGDSASARSVPRLIGSVSHWLSCHCIIRLVRDAQIALCYSETLCSPPSRAEPARSQRLRHRVIYHPNRCCLLPPRAPPLCAAIRSVARTCRCADPNRSPPVPLDIVRAFVAHWRLRCVSTLEHNNGRVDQPMCG